MLQSSDLLSHIPCISMQKSAMVAMFYQPPSSCQLNQASAKLLNPIQESHFHVKRMYSVSCRTTLNYCTHSTAFPVIFTQEIQNQVPVRQVLEKLHPSPVPIYTNTHSMSTQVINELLNAEVPLGLSCDAQVKKFNAQ